MLPNTRLYGSRLEPTLILNLGEVESPAVDSPLNGVLRVNNQPPSEVSTGYWKDLHLPQIVMWLLSLVLEVPDTLPKFLSLFFGTS